MHLSRHLRAAVMLGLLSGLLLALAPSAFADTINLTRFSKTVSGTADTGVTGNVTVDLLRNTYDNNTGSVQRNQVDSFQTTVGSGGAWSGSFASHAFSGPYDQVEVNYSGGKQVTTGNTDSYLLPTADTGTATAIYAPATSIDGDLGISTDGSTLYCEYYEFCSGYYTGYSWSATVDGSPAPAPANGYPGYITFTHPVTNADSIAVTFTHTQTDNGAGGTTTVNLTGSAPLLTPVVNNGRTPGPGDYSTMSEPECSVYLGTSQVVCHNLTPGSYKLTAGSSSQTVTVPAASGNVNNYEDYQWPDAAAAAFPSLAAGEKLALSQGSRTLTTLTVEGPKLQRTNPLSDPINDPGSTFTGSCAPGVPFVDGNGTCPANGVVPNDFGGTSRTLLDPGSEGNLFGQLDETSPGMSEVDLPVLDYSEPDDQATVSNPYIVTGQLFYESPEEVAYYDDSSSGPRLPSLSSTDPLVFAYAPVHSSSFTTLGNVNTAGGIKLPTLAAGWYQARWTQSDARGDSVTNYTRFYDEGPSSSQPVSIGPKVPRCKASIRRGLKVKIDQATLRTENGKKGKSHRKPKGHHKKKRKQKRSKRVTVTFNCSGSTRTGELALWMQRGRNIAADGSGVIRKGKSKIKLTGSLKKGTYSLIEVIAAAGKSAEATHVMTLR